VLLLMLCVFLLLASTPFDVLDSACLAPTAPLTNHDSVSYALDFYRVASRMSLFSFLLGPTSAFSPSQTPSPPGFSLPTDASAIFAPALGSHCFF
jgi:hypothetical protein